MIGTTFKLGFDGASVKKGLASVGGMMGRIGRQVGIGAARQVGAGMTDWVGKLVTMVPEAAKETMDWAGELVDLSNQTNATTKDLMMLGEAFRMSGMESVDAGRMIGQMQKTLFGAGTGDQGAQDALRALGLGVLDFDGLDPIARMKLIIAQMNKLKSVLEPGQLETISSDIFGGKIGLKTLRIFENLPAALSEAEKNLGAMGNKSKEELANLDELGDAMGRFTIAKYQLMTSLLTGIFGKDMQSGKILIDRMISSILQIGPILEGAGGFFRSLIDGFNKIILDMQRMGAGGFMSEAFSSVGEAIGRGITKSIKDALPAWAGGKKDQAMNSLSSSLIAQSMETNELLGRIYAKNPTAVFA